MMHSKNNITSLFPGFSSIVSLSDLNLLINLGVTEHERHSKQAVNISFKFFFKQKPKGCETDNIEDTVCYHDVSNTVKEYCDNKEFKLLEYMCNGLYRAIRMLTPSDVKIWIKIEKCSPPIDGLIGSTSFEYTDIGE